MDAIAVVLFLNIIMAFMINVSNLKTKWLTQFHNPINKHYTVLLRIRKNHVIIIISNNKLQLFTDVYVYMLC